MKQRLKTFNYQNVATSIIHILSIAFLLAGRISGLISQWYKTKMVSAADNANIKLAQISSDLVNTTYEHLSNKLELAWGNKERFDRKFKAKQAIQYWTIGLGTSLLILEHLLPDFSIVGIALTNAVCH
ncbi:hypothetical protein [Paraglaciecola sp. 20A4]|uniref:hypothetical protein n=1 Tax=Paraglaciecola sp. 20A4 TaxID=2687288 RepID=UPI00140971C5|nr:hypothetical protein [Paraglaciecola sp. 20A4]